MLSAVKRPPIAIVTKRGIAPKPLAHNGNQTMPKIPAVTSTIPAMSVPTIARFVFARERQCADTGAKLRCRLGIRPSEVPFDAFIYC